MREIKRSELIIGQEYYDMENIKSPLAVKLKLVEIKYRSVRFKHISGIQPYFTGDDGLIGFNLDDKESPFYQ